MRVLMSDNYRNGRETFASVIARHEPIYIYIQAHTTIKHIRTQRYATAKKASFLLSSLSHAARSGKTHKAQILQAHVTLAAHWAPAPLMSG